MVNFKEESWFCHRWMVILIMDANKSKIGDMTLSISKFRSLLISNQGRVVESWVKITKYQCES